MNRKGFTSGLICCDAANSDALGDSNQAKQPAKAHPQSRSAETFEHLHPGGPIALRGGGAPPARRADAMLETCCRPGEILSLQCHDVDLETRELTIRAEKAKTRRARRLPIASRLFAVLDMRRLDPTGNPFPPDAYVFGDRLGRGITSIRTASEKTRDAAGLTGFQLRDLRREAASPV